MNDLDLMEKFRADVPPADPERLASARARMFRAEAPKPATARWVWRLAPAAALAAAAVVAVVVVQAPDHSTPPSPPASGTADADGPQVLRLAAAEARQEPVLKARPDQFVYVESKVSWAGVVVGGPGAPSHTSTRYVPALPKTRQVWLSVDGSRDSLLEEAALKKPDADQQRMVNSKIPLGKVPAAYRRDLPTDAKAMRAYLYATDHGGNSRDDGAWSYVDELLREEYLPPASVAALFEAAATIPGTSVLRDQVDAAGRHGTAVARTEGGIRSELIFDASSYRFLGERGVAAGDVPGFPKNAVIGFTAQLKVAIVDRAGQRP